MFSVYLENVNVWCAMLTLDLYYLGIIYSVVVRYLIKHTALNKKKKNIMTNTFHSKNHLKHSFIHKLNQGDIAFRNVLYFIITVTSSPMSINPTLKCV